MSLIASELAERLKGRFPRECDTGGNVCSGIYSSTGEKSAGFIFFFLICESGRAFLPSFPWLLREWRWLMGCSGGEGSVRGCFPARRCWGSPPDRRALAVLPLAPRVGFAAFLWRAPPGLSWRRCDLSHRARRLKPNPKRG